MGHFRKSQDHKTSNISLGRRVGILVVVSFLLAEGLIVEGRGGSKRRGRGSGVGFGVPWETMKTILIVGAVIIGVFGIYICISICDAHDDEEDKSATTEAMENTEMYYRGGRFHPALDGRGNEFPIIAIPRAALNSFGH